MNRADGRIAAETITPCPPGVPAAPPGERPTGPPRAARAAARTPECTSPEPGGSASGSDQGRRGARRLGTRAQAGGNASETDHVSRYRLRGTHGDGLAFIHKWRRSRPERPPRSPLTALAGLPRPARASSCPRATVTGSGTESARDPPSAEVLGAPAATEMGIGKAPEPNRRRGAPCHDQSDQTPDRPPPAPA
ncbi:hypothetical protein [Streptomyces sp. NPDC048392]|uniref:hypothetical protein n=1 Tax=Streptomyces sp. NPDC048392 TaxID=3365543 RepID=UPI003722244F